MALVAVKDGAAIEEGVLRRQGDKLLVPVLGSLVQKCLITVQVKASP
jgi:hypothetical protein